MESRTTAVSIFRVEELDCATEENDLRAALGGLAQVSGLEFDLVARRVTVRHTCDSAAPLEAAIRGAGMRPRLITPAAAAKTPRLPRSIIITTVVAGVLAIGSEGLVIAGLGERSAPVIAVAVAAIALGGRETLRKGWQALTSRRLTMNLLMSVAAIGAMIIGQWPEAAVVIWLFGVAELIEALSLERARNAIRSLVALAPETAHVRTADGKTAETPAEAVELGAIVLIRPGERVPLDGVVVAGSSTVDQSPITGESIPVSKELGDAVFAGTVNERGTLDVEVTAAKGSGTLDRIAASIQQAQGERAPAQRFVDRFASVYTPLVFAMAIAVAAIPPLTGHGSLRDWLYKALVLLVLACPCALVISTPVTVVAALGGAARRGILIKGGVHLEGARKLRTIALDKTGTLTHGKPVLTDVRLLADLSEADVLRIAASIDALSEHPVAHAIVTAYDGVLATVTDFEAIPGRGARGTVDGVVHLVGNHRLAEDTGVCSPDIEAMLEGLEAEAKTAVVLMAHNRALAILAVADTIRPESVEAIAQLRALGVEPVMLTGDNTRTALAVARQVGITDARGDLLPDDKLRIVGELAARGPVAMIGDGVNDAPALAKANLGIAMGAAGTDTAIETADVALMDDDPRKLAELMHISAHTSHVLWQNIAVALGVKVVFFALTLTGTASLWLAVLADMGASLVVIANGLRLLNRPSHRSHRTPTITDRSNR
ncbi:MAG TPA: heavy metal translocating P-type ATPase [Ilumatobacteraceae bacterium]|nr:heavy metal translocating P-type ATPase [Ilumatobacteraceae bacterium]HRB02759.1 heavy metal translocating P-type ATPase [Ilumatobacteraceae bacterium]